MQFAEADAYIFGRDGLLLQLLEAGYDLLLPEGVLGGRSEILLLLMLHLYYNGTSKNINYYNVYIEVIRSNSSNLGGCLLSSNMHAGAKI